MNNEESNGNASQKGYLFPNLYRRSFVLSGSSGCCVLKQCVVVMNSVFPGTAGEADSKSIMPCSRF